jgi:tetratricopeptide (TPR) repeat protein
MMPLFVALGIFTLFFTAANMNSGPDFVRKALAVSFAAPAAAGFAQIFFPGFFGNLMQFGPKIPSLLGNPDFFSAYITAVLPVIFLFSFSSKGAGRTFYGILTAVALACLIKTGSKAAFFAVAAQAAAAVFIFRKEKNFSHKKIILVAALFLAVACAALPLVFRVPYSKAFDIGSYAANDSVFFRTNTWRGAFDMGLKNIATGTGPGSFSLAFPSFRPKEIMKWSVQSSYEVTYPENIFLQAFAELGLFGLLGAFIMVFIVLKNYDPDKKDFYLGFLGLMAVNLAGVDLNYVSSSMLAALFAGVIMNNKGSAGQKAVTAGGKYKTAVILLAALTAAGFATSLKKVISDTYLSRAIVFSGEKNWGAAVENYRKAVGVDKYNITAGYFLAQAYYDSNPSANATAALAELDKTGKLAPDYVLIHYKKAVILSAMNRPQEAEDEYKKMIKIDPYFKEALTALAYISYTMGDYEAALSYIKKAMEKYPGDAELYSYLGNIYFASKRPLEAVDAYKKAVEISGNKDYYYNLSCIYYALGEYAGAKTCIDGALKRGGTDDPKVEKMAKIIAAVMKKTRLKTGGN